MSNDKNTTKRDTKLTMNLIGAHIIKIAGEIHDDQVDALISHILAAKKIFVMGAGRSGLVGRAFAMRLMHLDLPVYVVGESVTPAVEKGDLLITISGSGETKSVVELALVGKQCGAKLVTITSNISSPLAKKSDVVIEVKGRSKMDSVDYFERQVRGEYQPLVPLGTIFETTSLVFLDGLISELMTVTKRDEKYLQSRHASLE
ncbi:MAG: 6-phospho-3-hexuloisomerase [Methanosarcinales archaeon Met12]|nr:MAG: 6-phospho-3-hexuloisomerase [Methanosarcinales archaeon Met12]